MTWSAGVGPAPCKFCRSGENGGDGRTVTHASLFSSIVFPIRFESKRSTRDPSTELAHSSTFSLCDREKHKGEKLSDSDATCDPIDVGTFHRSSNACCPALDSSVILRCGSTESHRTVSERSRGSSCARSWRTRKSGEESYVASSRLELCTLQRIQLGDLRLHVRPRRHWWLSLFGVSRRGWTLGTA